MSYFPVFMDLDKKDCLVIGGGRVGFRKIETLLRYGANIYLISREVIPEVSYLIDSQKISWIDTNFQEDHIKGKVLIIAATNDRGLNIRIKKAAEHDNIPVNIVDVPDLCSFIVPSIIACGDLTIAISTSGKSPALAKRIRKELSKTIGPEYAVLVEIMGKVREKQLAISMDSDINRNFFETLLNTDILNYIRQKNWTDCEKILTDVMGSEFTFNNLNIIPE